MMSPDEQQWLAEQAAKHVRIVEIGCARGGSTRILAENTKGVVYAVDDWKGVGLVESIPDLKEQFLENTKDLPNVKTLSMRSIDAELYFSVWSLFPDMIFIDAAHDYDNVKQDIESWLPLLQSGGLMCGHDSAAEGVTRAVKDVLGIDSGLTGIWEYHKP